MLNGLPKITHQEVMGLDSVSGPHDPRASFPLPAATSAMGRKARRQTNSKVIVLPGMLPPLKRAGDL